MQTTYLRICGLDVIGTDDGTEAVTLAVAADPHVLVVAAGLRGTDGFTVIRKLRAFKRTRHLPVILCAAGSDTRSLEAGGADGVVRKRCPPAELVAAIRTILGELRFS